MSKARRLNILHVSALQLWAMTGGAGMCCLIETLKGHQRAGHRVTVIVPGYDLWDKSAEPLGPPSQDQFEVHVAPCSWLKVLKPLWALGERMGDGREMPYLLRWVSGMVTWTLLSASLFWAAMKLIYRRRRRFDLVYAHCEYAAIAGWLIGLAARIPNVTRLYGTFVADLMRKPLVWLRYPIAAGGFLVPHSMLICANDGTRGDEVATRLGLKLDRFRFWQDGVDRLPPAQGKGRDWLLGRAPANLRPDSMWVLSCSRLDHWKRIDRVVRALGVARQAGCDCQLLIAGEGLEKERLGELVSQLGLTKDVVWLGAVPHDDVWTLMSLVDVFIIANDVTNRCNPLFEAIRAGLSVVSVRDPSTQDLLTDGENACLAQRDDGPALGQALTRLLQDPELAARTRQAQRGRNDLLWTWEERMEVETRDLAALAESCGRGGRDGKSRPHQSYQGGQA